MKRQPRDWKLVGLFALISLASAASGAYLAARYASPCVCLVAVQRGIVN